MPKQPQRPYAKRIMSRIDSAVKKSIKEYSSVVYGQMKQAFYNSISAYYDDYTPRNKHDHGYYFLFFDAHRNPVYHRYKYWKRKYSFFKALHANKNKDIELLTVDGINGFRVTLHISGRNINLQHNISKQKSGKNRPSVPDGNEWLFSRGYSESIHGFTPRENDTWGKNMKTDWHHRIPRYQYFKISGTQYDTRPLPRHAVPKYKAQDIADQEAGRKYKGYYKMTHDAIKEIRKNMRKSSDLKDIIKKNLRSLF